MAIASGIGARMFVGSTDLSGNVGQLTRMTQDQAQFDVTTISDEAFRRVGLVRHGMIDWRGFFDDNSDSGTSPHDTLRALPTTDIVATYLHRATRGAPAWSCVAKQVTHTLDRAQAGELYVDVNTVANGWGLELGDALTAGAENATGAANLAGVDNGAATSEGLSAYLHVLAFTGTSVDIDIQQSSDDGSGDAYADLVSFTTVTGVGSERIATAFGVTVEQWLRVQLSGTFSNLDFVVTVHRNTTDLG